MEASTFMIENVAWSMCGHCITLYYFIVGVLSPVLTPAVLRP